MGILLDSMGPSQRFRFAALLDSMIGQGICHAPPCKVQALPVVPFVFKIPVGDGIDSCAAFESSFQSAFTEAIAAATQKVGATSLVQVTCLDNPDDKGTLLVKVPCRFALYRLRIYHAVSLCSSGKHDG